MHASVHGVMAVAGVGFNYRTKSLLSFSRRKQNYKTTRADLWTPEEMSGYMFLAEVKPSFLVNNTATVKGDRHAILSICFGSTNRDSRVDGSRISNP